MSAYIINITIHLLAAFLWLGGMLFFAAVGAPVLRRVEPAELRTELFRRLGVAFRTVGWIAIVVLLVTGTLNLYFRGWLRAALSGDPLFWESRAGTMIGWKLALVVAMVALAALHDFWLGPLSLRTEPGSPAALRNRRAAAWLGRLNAILGILLIYVSVRIVRG